jgi:hypothetical protein
VEKIYQTGVKLTQAAMNELEERFERLPGGHSPEGARGLKTLRAKAKEDGYTSIAGFEVPNVEAIAQRALGQMGIDVRPTHSVINGRPLLVGEDAEEDYEDDEDGTIEQRHEDYKKVVSTADGEKSLYEIWTREKDGQMLAVLPSGYESKKFFIALTVASGEDFAGLQAGDRAERHAEVVGNHVQEVLPLLPRPRGSSPASAPRAPKWWPRPGFRLRWLASH